MSEEAEIASRIAKKRTNESEFERRMKESTSTAVLNPKRKYIPCLKIYAPDGNPFWVCSSSPLGRASSIRWLNNEFKGSDKQWSGLPDIKMVESRGVIDAFISNPDLPACRVFE